jgi:hypothetical protein
MDSRSNPHAGEFGRHWDPSTGMHCWDGANLDFDAWAYEGPDQLFTVVVSQMPPEQLQPADPVVWMTTMRDDGTVLVMSYTPEPPPTIQRVPFEAIPEPCQRRIWEQASRFRVDDDTVLLYRDGTWTQEDR